MENPKGPDRWWTGFKETNTISCGEVKNLENYDNTGQKPEEQL